jgi:hypothetical protein
MQADTAGCWLLAAGPVMEALLGQRPLWSPSLSCSDLSTELYSCVLLLKYIAQGRRHEPLGGLMGGAIARLCQTWFWVGAL